MNRELQTIIVEVEKAVVGKREVIEKILMALLADGVERWYGFDCRTTQQSPASAKRRWLWP